MATTRSRVAQALTRRALTPAVHWLDHRTRSARIRDGAARVLVGNVRPTDAVVSRLYWWLSAWYWAQLAQAPTHLESFAHGLGWCDGANRALDIGTGAGGSAALIAARFPSAEVIGTDISNAMIGRARRHHRAPNLRFVCAKSERLPFPDAAFDLITLLNAVPEMKEMRRLLAPGSRVLKASSFEPLSMRAASVRGRWVDFGFELALEADVGTGSCELFELPRDAPPAPPF